MKARWPAIVVALAWVATIGWLAADGSASAPELDRDRATALYEEGRYDEARKLLEELDQAGLADGAALYRLHYCQRVANDPQAMATLQRARELLESEAPKSPGLEASFYLANAYANLNRIPDARRVAAEATSRLETGAIPEPRTAVDMFRAGKLFADQQRADQAARWYERALEAFAAQGSAATSAYVKWAGRYLAERALGQEQYDKAERFLTALVSVGDTSMQDWDRLAVVRARLGLYREAGEAWRRAERIDPPNANRARYCYRLTDLAVGLEQLSAAAPDGRLWTELTKEELESIMQAQAALAREMRQQAAETKPSPEERKNVVARLQQAKGVFVGAALEYALQGHSIREAAFFGGYAPLIFKPTEWELR